MIDDGLKFVVLGEGGSRKGEVLKKYFKIKFNEGEKPKIPILFEKTVDYNGKAVQLKFLGTAGQALHYQNPVGALLIYDASIFETFEILKSWIITLHKIAGKDMTILVAGNKFDLIDKNTIEEQKPSIESYCTKESIKHFFYISSKTGFDIDEVFDTLIVDTLNKVFSSTNGLVTRRRGRKLEISPQ